MAFRSIDGSGNNLADPLMNAAGQPLERLTDRAPFETDINPRVISNIVIGQGNPEVPNKLGLSELWTTMGQFIDHDLDLVRSGGADISIPVPADDKFFTPGSLIQVTRAQVDAHGDPINSITGWLDLSQVYGSDQARANSLKAADGAHLAMSAGDNLPIVDGQFKAGDVRVGENDYLTSIQTIFAREHNFQVDKLAAEHPGLTGEALYQQAKAITTAEYENIVVNEWLAAAGIKLDKYHGYDSHVDATISPEFTSAAFRFGHSMVGDAIENVDAHGNTVSERSLAQDFLDGPDVFLANGAEGFLRSQVSEAANELDARIVSSLRNFLVDGGPVSDLAAINIRRGEDTGLGHLNDVRQDLGLKPYTKFEQITSDKATVAALKEAYHGDVNSVDVWVGGLAENHKAGHLLGQTFETIVSQTFENLRDGDRFWFQNTAVSGFDKKELKAIEHTTFADIIERNSDADVQKDVFIAQEINDGNGHHNDHHLAFQHDIIA